MTGRVLDRRYQTIEVLGKGAFGHTFLAKDTKRPGNPICVVKQLKPSFSEPEFLKKARELFNREAESLHNLGEHRQIPRLLAYFEENKEFYLVQEYIVGKTLDKELIPGQSLAESQVIFIVKDLLEILDFVHSHNVIHRDIKPSNIIRREQDNKLVLIDFGAVKNITTEGQQRTIIIGTPGYMPIEQSHGQPNFCSDIYAVGMIGIQALTGIKPQPSTDSQENVLCLKVAQVSSPLAAILTKMVRYDYRERYQSALEALQEIQDLENSHNATILIPQKPFKRLSELIKKILTYSSFIAVILVGIGIKLWYSGYSPVKLPLNGKLVKSVLDSEDVCDNLIETLYCEKYLLSGQKDQRLIIEMNSQDFDPYLILRRPDGNKLAVSSDISPSNWNAKITVNLPEDGKYLAITRTSSNGESGSYSIRAMVE